MLVYVFRASKAIAQRLVALLIGVVLFLGLTQTPVWAVSSQIQTEPGVAVGITELVPDENIDELKEQRREWQSQASLSRDSKNDEHQSLGETVKEKLNLTEITEGYDPEKKSESFQPSR
jgi:hypothetical protein